METKLSNLHEEDFILDDGLYNELQSKISAKEQKTTDRRMLLAKQISTAMKAKGWKQIDLSRIMEKDPAIISRWLSGTHSFNIETLWEISDTLGIELITLNEKEKSDEYITGNTITLNYFSKNILNSNQDLITVEVHQSVFTDASNFKQLQNCN